MKKILTLGVAFVVSLAMLLSSCKKEEVNNNGNNNGNTENPGGGSGGGSGSGNQDHILPDAVTDIDGNSYDAVQLGNQVWMAENLRTTRYANGAAIPLGTSSSTSTPYCYNPNNDANNVPTYGYLYNWPAVMHGASSSSSNPSGVQGICPDGWHVPSEAEWTQLEDYVESQSQYQCGNDNECIAKALSSTTGWKSSTTTYAVGNNQSSNNATGFSAFPAGIHNVNYFGFGLNANFWSATECEYGAFSRTIYYDLGYMHWSDDLKYYGLSVRCVRN